jgi:glutamate-1-semialdehyde 2,1-aminomutase
MAAAFAANPGQVAALIVEPIPGNMGLVPPKPGYLQALRRLCDEAGTVLIFDEVISGFRAAAGGAQGRFSIRPDMTCLGKIMGGGLPLGAYGGRADIMKVVAPEGPVYQAGTLSGNPLAMAAGLAMLGQLNAKSYERLEAMGARLEAGLNAAIAKTGIAACVQRVGSAFTLFFCAGPIADFAAAKKADPKVYADFFHGMLDRGFYLPPAQLEAAFISLAHTDTEIDSFIAAAQETMATMRVLR